MSVPPEVLQRMTAGRAGAPSGAPPGGAGMRPGAAPSQVPGGSPTPQIQDKRGLKAAAMSNLTIARNMLEQALTAFDEGKEYDTVYKCIGLLSKISAKSDGNDLVPAEVMRMVGQLPQMGGGTDMQRMILQQMQRPQGGAQQPGQAQQPPQGAM